MKNEIKEKNYTVVVAGISSISEKELLSGAIKAFNNNSEIVFFERDIAEVYTHSRNGIDLFIVSSKLFGYIQRGVESTFATHSPVGVVFSNSKQKFKTDNGNIFMIEINKEKETIIGILNNPILIY